MRLFPWGRMALLLGVLIISALVPVGRWLNANKIGGQGPAEPFRIAGNFYYVGATDVSAFLITGPEGHVVLDAGYPTTARLIMTSIAKLGAPKRNRPVARPTAFESPTTATGSVRAVVLRSPSWPQVLKPQQTAVPVARVPHVWSPSIEIETLAAMFSAMNVVAARGL